MATATPKTQYRPSEVFTPEMRDRQARGKDPYSKGEGSDSDGSADAPMRLGHAGSVTESFAERERRGEAIAVLDCPETLMAHAQATGDSISGQRLRFMRQLCGFDDKRQETTTPSGPRGHKSRRVGDHRTGR